MGNLDEVIRLLVKFGDAAILEDKQIKRANTELAVLRGELTYYRRMFLEKENCHSEVDKKPLYESGIVQDIIGEVVTWIMNDQNLNLEIGAVLVRKMKEKFLK